MDDDAFQSFIDTAQQELAAKQEALMADYDLGTFPRFLFDQPSGTLRFFDQADRLAVEAEAIHIGSFAAESRTWKWAWANESVLPGLRQRAEPLRELVQVTGFDLFGDDAAFAIEDEAMAWELAAMSVQHLGALGCYRAPASGKSLLSFLAIMDIRKLAG